MDLTTQDIDKNIASMHSDNFWDHHQTMVIKKSYLNKNFFFIRMAIYFIVWFLLISRLYNLSINQKTELDKIRLKRTSAAGVGIFAITVSFFGFDAIMSLDPSWYSTMFGVYIFTGAYFSSIGFVLLVSLYLKRNPLMPSETILLHPGTSEQTMGLPIDAASSKNLEVPSL